MSTTITLTHQNRVFNKYKYLTNDKSTYAIFFSFKNVISQMLFSSECCGEIAENSTSIILSNTLHRNIFHPQRPSNIEQR